METPESNRKQVGGDHYGLRYVQPWDFIAHAMGNRFLEGSAMKCLHRWTLKRNPIDIRKALHYIEKAMELARGGKLHSLQAEHDAKWRANHHVQVDQAYFEQLFFDTHKTPYLVRDIVNRLSHWRTVNDLDQAHKAAAYLLDHAEAQTARHVARTYHPQHECTCPDASTRRAIDCPRHGVG